MGGRSERVVNWELLVAVISALMSLGALFISVRVERRTAAPNVELTRVEGSRLYHNAREGGPDRVSIVATASLHNRGNSSVEIVDVHWEPLLIGEPVARDSAWLAISDDPLPTDSARIEHYKRQQRHPVLGIKQTVIRGNEQKLLYLRFSGLSDLARGRETPNIRVVITFSNGVELTVLPEIKYTGVSGSYQ
jgi:hypothetical protein